MWSQLARAFQDGDAYIYILLVLGFLGTVIAFERFLSLQFLYHINFSKFLINLKKMVKAEDLDRAISLCKKTSHTSLPLISLRALEAAETDPTTVKGTIEEEAMDFLPKLERRLGLLPALATLTLLIGVLGTIDSIWSAFHSIDVLDTAEKQAAVGYGIAGSLSYTALGIIFCMFFLVAHQLLKGIALTLIDKIHQGVVVLSNLLVPQEVAYMPVAEAAAGASAGAAPLQSFEAPSITPVESVSPPAETQGASASDGFDDATVEDIKDEEEII